MSQEEGVGKLLVTLDEEDRKLLDAFNLSITHLESVQKAYEKAAEERQQRKKALWIHICRKHNLDPEGHYYIDRQKGLVHESSDAMVRLSRLLGFTESAAKED